MRKSRSIRRRCQKSIRTKLLGMRNRLKGVKSSENEPLDYHRNKLDFPGNFANTNYVSYWYILKKYIKEKILVGKYYKIISYAKICQFVLFKFSFVQFNLM